MANNDVVIKVQGVYKNFLLPHERNTTIKSAFLGLAHKNTKSSSEIQHALKDVSFEVKKGEFFGIVGRNGSGKSTLLKMLAGIYEPTRGKIGITGKIVPFIELGVGFNPELSGRDNVYLNGALLGFSTQDIDSIYDDIVEFAELEKFMDQKLKNYSSGMQVRLAFSMAIRAKADVLLIDEVLAVGDADFQRKCFEYFKQLKSDDTTVVFVSHDMDAVREYCDRAVLIDKNEVIARGAASEVASKYSKLFIKSTTTTKLESRRWGEGPITYTGIQVPKVLTNEDSIKIVLKAKSDRLIDKPIFGLQIKTTEGTPLLGTNTKIQKSPSGEITPGHEITVEWIVPNIFSSGKYYIEPAIVRDDGMTVCDWWERAASFDVFKEEKTPFPIAPKVKVSLKKGKK